MRDRLIDILMSKPYGHSSYEEFADYLLAKGVVVLPCKVGETVYADIIHRRNGDFIDECIVKCIEWGSDWDDPLFTIVCRERATYRTYWASEFGKEFFKEPKFAEKSVKKKRSGNGT